MDSSISDEAIARTRKIALSAEPYDEDSDEMNTFDGEWTPEQRKRIDATVARSVLRQAGIPLEE